jgi:DNA transposition AAA+ family ATPase
VDEAHFLWPINAVRKRLSRPRRLEFIREIHDTAGIGIVLLTTPQHAELLHQCIQSNELWAPGQWDGRAQPFLLPEALDDADLEAIARWHGPDLADEAIAPLLAMAKSSEGYLGKMVKAIERARFFYASGGTIRAADILSAQRSMEESNLSLRRKLK